MQIEMYQTVSGDWILNDYAEDAPLAKIHLSNELAELDLEEQLKLMYEFKLIAIEALRLQQLRKQKLNEEVI